MAPSCEDEWDFKTVTDEVGAVFLFFLLLFPLFGASEKDSQTFVVVLEAQKHLETSHRLQVVGG